MHTQRSSISSQRGYALIYMCVVLAVLLIFTGLAVDTGRAYVVQAQLSKAVDGAALAAARNLNSGDPKAEAITVFRANFPAGYLGTLSSTDPTTDANFFKSSVNATTGVNTVTVNATATLPTTFMKLANFNTVNVSAMGEATRRMVDLSLILDVSSSIGSQWTAVRDAARVFVNAFDKNNDRVALLTFSNGVSILDAMPAGRGFDKAKVYADVPTTLPGGSTNMVEGLYRGWDELRSVAPGQQSGLRVIVLFTDGASNSVPGNYDAAPGLGRTIRTYDFPKVLPDPDGQTWDAPTIAGLYATNTANSPSGPNINGANGSSNVVPSNWDNKCLVAADFNDVNCPSVAKYLPLVSYHANHRSPGIPTSFPFMTSSLTVNGVSQSTARPLRDKNATTNRYPTEVYNINNAARNLVEIIADAARADTGDYPIRIYTIGMGELVRYKLGTRKEMSEEILKRIANDVTSPDFNETQMEGKYYYAKTAADVGPAFQALQNQIIRLSK
jgi:Flp pilus assembly protein TadG